MKILVGDIVLNYEQMGQGNPIVILHGWGRSLREWLPVAEKLSEKHFITVIDLPGFGSSEESNIPWDTFDYASKVFEFLRKVGISECVILGHSFGGRIATILAAQYPDIVKKIVLVDSGGIEIKPLSVKIRIFVYKYFVKHVKRIVPQVLRELTGSADYKSVSGILRKSFVKIVNQDLQYLFGSIKQPVLIIWGSNDQVLPVKYVKMYQALMPQAVTRIIWGSGHSPHVEKQNEFLLTLKDI